MIDKPKFFPKAYSLKTQDDINDLYDEWADSYDEELHTVLSDWMGEDACAQNPKACEALLAALGDGGDDDDEEE